MISIIMNLTEGFPSPFIKFLKNRVNLTFVDIRGKNPGNLEKGTFN